MRTLALVDGELKNLAAGDNSRWQRQQDVAASSRDKEFEAHERAFKNIDATNEARAGDRLFLVFVRLCWTSRRRLAAKSRRRASWSKRTSNTRGHRASTEPRPRFGFPCASCLEASAERHGLYGEPWTRRGGKTKPPARPSQAVGERSEHFDGGRVVRGGDRFEAGRRLHRQGQRERASSLEPCS